MRWIIEPLICTDYVVFYAAMAIGWLWLYRRLNRIEDKIREVDA